MDKKETSDALSMEQEGISRQLGESKLRFFGRQLFLRKDVDGMINSTKENELKRSLNAFHLTCIGVGTIIGSGIFVYSGTVAAKNAGPAVVLSFMIAGFVAGLSALCYSEIASMIPVAGSAYSYTYATMGEFVAWMVGWVLILEYMVGCAAVGVGWSGYLTKFFADAFSTKLNPVLIGAFVKFHEATTDDPTSHFALTGNYFNLPAFIVISLLSLLLIVGTKESASLASVIVTVKVAIILVFIFGTVDKVEPANWSPFLPPAKDDYYGHYRIMGVLKGASVVFFCYTGFDAVSTAALESKNPKRDMPIGIISSLTVSTALYILVSLVMCGIAPYQELNVDQPISIAVSFTGRKWLELTVGLGAVVGMSTTMFATMMAQTRIFYTMSRDGLLPGFFGKVHPRFKTPYIAQAIVGFLAATIAAIFPVDVLGELTGMGTLFGFCLVCIGTMMLRIKRPDLPRGFRVPFGPYFIPILGALPSAGLIFTSSPAALARLFIWILIGILVYFVYGFRNSRINNPEKWANVSQSSPVIPEH